MVCALAGRRIDQPATPLPRFPVENIRQVRDRIRSVLEIDTTTLVCSAACGADLIALELGGTLGIRRRIVLPFARERFRETSVVDRPGDWGPTFDRIMDEVEGNCDAVVLQYEANDASAYAGANAAILSEAERLARELAEGLMAVIVWDGKPRGDEDLTAELRDEANRRGYTVFEVSTVSERSEQNEP
jgi:hypothetical protein